MVLTAIPFGQGKRGKIREEVLYPIFIDIQVTFAETGLALHPKCDAVVLAEKEQIEVIGKAEESGEEFCMDKCAVICQYARTGLIIDPLNGGIMKRGKLCIEYCGGKTITTYACICYPRAIRGFRAF